MAILRGAAMVVCLWMFPSLAIAAPSPNENTGCREFDSHRTPSKSWSRTGWQKLRWGMGPADVRVAMSLEEFECRSLRQDPDGPHLAYRAITSQEIFGERIGLGFSFPNAAVRMVTVSPIEAKREKSRIRCERWYKQVVRALEARYGVLECEKETAISLAEGYGKWKRCSVDSHSFGLVASIVFSVCDPCDSVLSFQDLEFVLLLRMGRTGHVDQREAEKL